MGYKRSKKVDAGSGQTEAAPKRHFDARARKILIEVEKLLPTK
jgi:hypothetical protein